MMLGLCSLFLINVALLQSYLFFFLLNILFIRYNLNSCSTAEIKSIEGYRAALMNNITTAV